MKLRRKKIFAKFLNMAIFKITFLLIMKRWSHGTSSYIVIIQEL